MIADRTSRSPASPPSFALLSLLGALALPASAARPPAWTAFPLDSGEVALELFTAGHRTLLATDARVVDLAHGRTLFRAGCPVRDVSVLGGEIALATACGVERYDVRAGSGGPVEGLSEPATQVCLDYGGALWVADGRRVIRYVDGGPEPVARVTDALEIAATPDGSVWFATAIGLIQARPSAEADADASGLSWFVHEEEARRGFELPDTYIDDLYGHGQPLLWVATPEALTLLNLADGDATADHGHLPSVSSFGPRGNRVYDARYLPAQDYALLATDVGVLAIARADLARLGESAAHQAGREVMSELRGSGLRVVATRASVGAPADDPIRAVATGPRGAVYLYGARGYVALPSRRVRRVLAGEGKL